MNAKVQFDLADAQDMWSAALTELELALPRATYREWLADSRVVEVADAGLVVGVRNEQAQAWLANRLQDTVERAVAGVAGGPLDVAFRPLENGFFEQPAAQGAEDVDPGSGQGGKGQIGNAAGFAGFGPISSNFTTVPNQFFEVVLPDEPPALTAFVGAVIYQTIGHIVNWHTGERREWWDASYVDIGEAAGICKSSALKVIRLAVERGYVVREESGNSFRYRLRRLGEPVGVFSDDED